MYRVFIYRVDDESACGLYIDDDLFEIAKDVSWFDGSCLKTIARPAFMNAFVNSYFSRW